MATHLTSQENASLLTQTMSGDTVARDTMITGNMALVLFKVDAFIDGRPALEYLRDDLTSVGFVGLVRAINAVADGARVENLYNYVLTAIAHELQGLVDLEHSIPVPRSTRRAARARGIILSPPVCVNTLSAQLLSVADSDYEMRDLLDAGCESHEDREVIRMREEGYTYSDIAAQIQVSRPTVHRMLRRLAQVTYATLEALT